MTEKITNWAHSAMAVVGVISMASGLFIGWLNTNHGQVPVGVYGFLIGAGSTVTLLSKFCDSLNAAWIAKHN